MQMNRPKGNRNKYICLYIRKYVEHLETIQSSKETNSNTNPNKQEWKREIGRQKSITEEAQKHKYDPVKVWWILLGCWGDYSRKYLCTRRWRCLDSLIKKCTARSGSRDPDAWITHTNTITAAGAGIKSTKYLFVSHLFSGGAALAFR